MAKIAQLIKYEGDNTTFVWKHPEEDFNAFTQLIVHETQEAVFMMNGEILDVFGAGRYTLNTQNIPKIGKALNRQTGDESPFHSEVYFINKTEQPAIKWGTDSRVEFIEPSYGFPISVGAYGEMTLRADNSKKLLMKLVGTERNLSQATLVNFFRSFLMTKIKPYIAKTIRESKISIFEIDEHLSVFSEKIHELLKPDFYEYGLSLERFFVTTVSKPDGEPNYEKFKSIHFRKYSEVEEAQLRKKVGIIDTETEAEKLLITSRATAEKRRQEGYTYAQERGFDVAEKVAQNEGQGNLTGLGVGLGAMAGIGGTVGNIVGKSMQATEEKITSERKCKNCGAILAEGAKFCPECGEKAEPDTNFIICPNCKKSVPRTKFCQECGFKLINICKKCGAQAPIGAKFCPECGEEL